MFACFESRQKPHAWDRPVARSFSRTGEGLGHRIRIKQKGRQGRHCLLGDVQYLNAALAI